MEFNLIGVKMKKLFLPLFLTVALLCTQQIIAQTQINQANIYSFPYSINATGSYILTSNLVVPNGASYGIYVTAPNVTINLNGFTISGNVVCTNTNCNFNGVTYGIYSSYPNTTVMNGAISGFYYDVIVGTGNIKDIAASSAYVGIYGNAANIHNNTVFSCMGYGIYVNYGTATNNTISDIGYYGIYGINATVVNNNVTGAKINGIVVSTGLAMGNSTLNNTSSDLVLQNGAIGSSNACTHGAC
jgi:hypothetical protein